MTPAVAVPASVDRDGLALQRLVREALRQGLQHARDVGAPVQPFLLSERGTLEYLFDHDERTHPLERAVRLLQCGAAADARQLALVMSSRLPLPAGGRSDAILVLACARGGGEAQVWAQAYRAPRWYRAFASIGAPWPLGPALNLFREAESTRSAIAG